MKLHPLVTTLGMALVILAAAACSGPRVHLVQVHVEESRVGTPVRDVLVVVVLDDREIKRIFEQHFKDWLNAKGVEAITSSDVLPTEAGVQLTKAAVLEAVDQHGNDSVLITHLVEYGETEVFSRDRPQFFFDYYGFYQYAWGYVTWPTIYGERVQFSLETRLYDVKSGSLVWAGESQLTNPKTTGHAIGQVVEAVMKDLAKQGLLPDTTKKKQTS